MNMKLRKSRRIQTPLSQNQQPVIKLLGNKHWPLTQGPHRMIPSSRLNLVLRTTFDADLEKPMFYSLKKDILSVASKTTEKQFRFGVTEYCLSNSALLAMTSKFIKILFLYQCIKCCVSNQKLITEKEAILLLLL